MPYHVLADGVMVLHLAWILFVCCGAFLALRRPRVAWAHAPALICTLVWNIMGWYCPLTDLEHHLLALQGEPMIWQRTFVSQYLPPFIYPDLSERWIRAGAILFAGFNLAAYGIFWRRIYRRRIGNHGP